MREGWDQQATFAYLSAWHLGTMMRLRDMHRRGEYQAAQAVIKESIATHLRLVVEDADEAWIAAMVEGRPGRVKPDGAAGR